MSIGNVAPQETPESEENKPLQVVYTNQRCPECHRGFIDTWYRDGEVGFRDNCDTCDFEGINITEWFDPSPYLSD